MTVREFGPWERDVNMESLIIDDANTMSNYCTPENILHVRVSNLNHSITVTFISPKFEDKITLPDIGEIAQDLHKVVDKYLQEYSKLDYTVDRDYDKIFKIIKFLMKLNKEIAEELKT